MIERFTGIPIHISPGILLDERSLASQERITTQGKLITETLRKLVDQYPIWEPLDRMKEILPPEKMMHHSIDLYKISSKSDSLALDGIVGEVLSYVDPDSMRRGQDSHRLLSYGGLVVVRDIDIDTSKAEIEKKVENNLHFWHGQLSKMSNVPTDVNHPFEIFNEAKRKIISDVMKLDSKSKFRKKSRLFLEALPLNEQTLYIRLQEFSQGIADK